jgi:hypothetical protein
MNKRALVYLALASATLAVAFLYTTQIDQPVPVPVSPPSEAAQAFASVSVMNGQLTTQPLRIQGQVGKEVKFLVYTNQADELHVHGIDQTIALPANETTLVTIATPQVGVYEMELHNAGIELGQIEVDGQ